ncbi:retrovirus-related pol polyprotein from transposon TNT 1-94 [Tanacetum coccineum]
MDQSADLRIFGSDAIKLDRKDGMNFTRWKEKMKFMLTAFKVYYVLEGLPIGVMTEEEEMKREQDETLCRGYILSTLADCLKKLMHTSEDFTLDQILKHLRIEEETRIFEKNLNGASSSKVNYVDSRKNNKGNDKKRKGTWNSSKDNKKDKKPLSEAWYDSGATTHVCNNRDLFKTNKKTEDGHDVIMKQPEGFVLQHKSLLWGCLSYYKVPLPNTSKLGPRGLKSVFAGYAKDSKSYRCLDLDSNVIVESRDVDFFENKFRHDSTSTNEIMTQILQNISGPNLNFNNKRNMAESSSAPGISKRARKERNLDPDFIDSQAIIFLVEGDNENIVVNKIPVLLNVEDAPKTYKEAITSKNFALWNEAIDNEMDSLVSNNTWELSDLPPGSKAIGCRWVFRIKYHTDGSIQSFKVRLVIQGFSQRQGIDYFDTYAPVARITSIRVLFALTSIYNLHIHQMNVKTAFLNCDLDEEVYMKQPEGFVLPGHENKVCKLKKSLYGLKQTPKQWHDKFDKSILSNDDILIVRTNMEGVNETKKFLSLCFQMKDMNEVDTILGIKVKRQSGGYALNQCHYTHKIIDKFQHLNIEEANNPYESSCKLVENDGRAVAQIEYASAIGCLMYTTHCTRPDIAYAVCKLSRYTSNLSQDHWKAIGRVFGYLKITRQLALYYDHFSAVLDGYSDASWMTGSNDSKSTTGWIFTLGGGAICWGSKKQTCITHSTMEAEFLALVVAGKEPE